MTNLIKTTYKNISFYLYEFFKSILSAVSILQRQTTFYTIKR